MSENDERPTTVDVVAWLARVGICDAPFREALKERILDQRRKLIDQNSFDLSRRFVPWSTESEAALRDLELFQAAHALGLAVATTLAWDGKEFSFTRTLLPASYIEFNPDTRSPSLLDGLGLSLTEPKTEHVFRDARTRITEGHLNNVVAFSGQLTAPLDSLNRGVASSHDGDDSPVYQSLVSLDGVLKHLSGFAEPVSVTFVAEPLPDVAAQLLVDELLKLISFCASNERAEITLSSSTTIQSGRSELDPSKRIHRAAVGGAKVIANFGGAAAGGALGFALGGPLGALVGAGLGTQLGGALGNVDLADLFGWNATVTSGKSEQEGSQVQRAHVDERFAFLAQKNRDLLHLIDSGGAHGLWTWFGAVHAKNRSTAEAAAALLIGRLSTLSNTLEPIRKRSIAPGSNDDELITDAVLHGYIPRVEGTFGALGAWYGSLARSETLPVVFAGPLRGFQGLKPTLTLPVSEGPRAAPLDIVMGHRPERPDLAVGLSREELATHMLIAGRTGSGKTLLLRRILKGASTSGTRFLFIDMAQPIQRGMWASAQEPMFFSSPTEDIDFPSFGLLDYRSADVFHDYLWQVSDLLAHWLPSEGPLPLLFEELLREAFSKFVDVDTGFHLSDDGSLPKLAQLEGFIDRILSSETGSRYGGEVRANLAGALLTRLRRLNTPGLRRLLEGSSEQLLRSLGKRDLVVSLSQMGSANERSMLALVLLMKARQYLRELRAAEPDAQPGVRLIIAIDEAHVLLRQAPDRGQAESDIHAYAIRFFDDLVAEIRQLGGAVIVVDQSPSLLATSVIFGTATKVVFALPQGRDQEVMADSTSVRRDRARLFGGLPQRVAYLRRADGGELELLAVPLDSEEA